MYTPRNGCTEISPKFITTIRRFNAINKYATIMFGKYVWRARVQTFIKWVSNNRLHNCNNRNCITFNHNEQKNTQQMHTHWTTQNNPFVDWTDPIDWSCSRCVLVCWNSIHLVMPRIRFHITVLITIISWHYAIIVDAIHVLVTTFNASPVFMLWQINQFYQYFPLIIMCSTFIRRNHENIVSDFNGNSVLNTIINRNIRLLSK